jgi:hypothetical protein
VRKDNTGREEQRERGIRESDSLPHRRIPSDAPGHRSSLFSLFLLLLFIFAAAGVIFTSGTGLGSIRMRFVRVRPRLVTGLRLRITGVRGCRCWIVVGLFSCFSAGSKLAGCSCVSYKSTRVHANLLLLVLSVVFLTLFFVRELLASAVLLNTGRLACSGACSSSSGLGTGELFGGGAATVRAATVAWLCVTITSLLLVRFGGVGQIRSSGCGFSVTSCLRGGGILVCVVVILVLVFFSLRQDDGLWSRRRLHCEHLLRVEVMIVIIISSRHQICAADRQRKRHNFRRTNARRHQPQPRRRQRRQRGLRGSRIQHRERAAICTQERYQRRRWRRGWLIAAVCPCDCCNLFIWFNGAALATTTATDQATRKAAA